MSIEHKLGLALAANEPFSCRLSPWPFWGQLVDWTWKGEQDVNREFNCGPESLAMVIKYIRGVELPAAYIKDVEYGSTYVGYTDFMHMQQFLRQYCEVDSTLLYPQSVPEFTYHVWDYLHRGMPLIGLFYFSSPGSNDGHLRPIIGIDNALIYTADPWTAQPRNQNYGDAWDWLQNMMLGIKAVRHV